MSKFDSVVRKFLPESEESAVMVRRELEQFYKSNKKDFIKNSSSDVKKTLSDIKKENDDVKLINLVSSFFGYLDIPDLHEEFIDHIMGML
tara:strand:- start:44 stop:313 length:270 start_codon:yes stop_codon:yes gene_type:complete